MGDETEEATAEGGEDAGAWGDLSGFMDDIGNG